MHLQEGRFVQFFQILILTFLIAMPLHAQSASTAFSGTITDSLGSAVPNATVTLKNIFTGKEQNVTADASGKYTFTNLEPGNYRLSASADGFATKTEQVTLESTTKQTKDLELIKSSSSAAGPSLSELGFPSSELSSNPREQALLNKRSHMLQIHQKLGLVTAGLMVATLLTSPGAKGHHGLPGPAGGRNLHMALGATTGLLYAATAYYAIRAPKVGHIRSHGAMRWHKALAWVHGPGMIATVILGIMAYNQLSNGERLHGLAKYHSDAAFVTAAAFGGAILSVSVK